MLKQYLQLPRQIHVLCVGTLINRTGMLLVIFLTLYIQEKLGFEEKFATWAMGAFGLGSVGAVLIGGHVADAVGRRVVMLGALFGGAAVLIVFPALTTKPAIICGVILFAFLSDMYRPAAQAMIADLVAGDQRVHAFNLNYLSINVGAGIAPLIGGLLAKRSYRLLFWTDAGTAMIYGAIILLFMRETIHLSRASTKLDDAGPPAENVRALDAARHIIKDHVFLVYCGASLVLAMTYMQCMSTLPLYLRRQGFGPADYGHIVAVNGVMITLFQLPLVAYVTRFNRATLVVIAAFITGIGFGATGFAHVKSQYMATVAVWTLGEMLAAPFGAAIISDLAPSRMRARYMGVFSTCFCSANMIGAPLGGWILQEHGGGVLWTATLFMGATAALLYLTVHRHIGSRSDHQPATMTDDDSGVVCVHCGGLPVSINLAECPNCGRPVARPALADGV